MPKVVGPGAVELNPAAAGAYTRFRRFRQSVICPEPTFPAREDGCLSVRPPTRKTPLGEIRRKSASRRTLRVWRVFVSLTTQSCSSLPTLSPGLAPHSRTVTVPIRKHGGRARPPYDGRGQLPRESVL